MIPEGLRRLRQNFDFVAMEVGARDRERIVNRPDRFYVDTDRSGAGDADQGKGSRMGQVEVQACALMGCQNGFSASVLSEDQILGLPAPVSRQDQTKRDVAFDEARTIFGA